MYGHRKYIKPISYIYSKDLLYYNFYMLAARKSSNSLQNTASTAALLRVVRCVHFVIMAVHPEATGHLSPLVMNLRHRHSSQQLTLKEKASHNTWVNCCHVFYHARQSEIKQKD